MKTIITLLLSAFIFSAFSQSFDSDNTFEQSYTTVTKSCGSCGGAVSSSSCVGMTCPHCHVRWGYENTSHSTSYSKHNTTAKYIPSSGSATTNSSANLRTGPSTGYSVISTMPPYATVTIEDKSGSWVKVSYQDYSSSYGSSLTGWVHSSLLSF